MFETITLKQFNQMKFCLWHGIAKRWAYYIHVLQFVVHRIVLTHSSGPAFIGTHDTLQSCNHVAAPHAALLSFKVVKVLTP